MGALDKLFGGMRIASTGLKAERARVDVIAKNIANSQVTRVPGTGEAYRREMVDLAPMLRRNSEGVKEVVGVEVLGTRSDTTTPFQEIVDPGHPDADAAGIVRYPNVNTVKEMAALITAVRAYEANLSVQENYERLADRALRLME
ncbi:MAG: flagellar basal body rod protein FlgC [Planctomycetota bacterium]|nr:flagellar basal body rod protein FlgC [Planctomycetota bacterium]